MFTRFHRTNYILLIRSKYQNRLCLQSAHEVRERSSVSPSFLEPGLDRARDQRVRADGMRRFFSFPESSPPGTKAVNDVAHTNVLSLASLRN